MKLVFNFVSLGFYVYDTVRDMDFLSFFLLGVEEELIDCYANIDR